MAKPSSKKRTKKGCKILDKRVTGEWIDGGYRHLFVLAQLKLSLHAYVLIRAQ
jgi:hypothetical protein